MPSIVTSLLILGLFSKPDTMSVETFPIESKNRNRIFVVPNERRFIETFVSEDGADFVFKNKDIVEKVLLRLFCGIDVQGQIHTAISINQLDSEDEDLFEAEEIADFKNPVSQ